MEPPLMNILALKELFLYQGDLLESSKQVSTSLHVIIIRWSSNGALVTQEQ